MKKSARKKTTRNLAALAPEVVEAPEEATTATAAELEDGPFQIYPADIARVVLAAEGSLHRGKKETLSYPAMQERIQKHLDGRAESVNPDHSRRQQAADSVFVAIVDALKPFLA